jgi:vesicle-fusing ATPase
MSFKVKFQVGNLPSNRLALTNKIYVSPKNAEQMAGLYAQHGIEGPSYPVLLNGNHPYSVEGHPQIADTDVALNSLQRRYAKLSLAATVTLTPLLQPAAVANATLTVDFLSKTKRDPKAKPHEVDTDRLAQAALLVLEGQVVAVGQALALDFEGTKMELVVNALASVEKKKKKTKEGKVVSAAVSLPMGQLLAPTSFSFGRAEGSTAITLTGERVLEGSGGGSAQSIFLNDFDFEKLGIGGLDAEFNQIFRRAFASRIWPPHIIKQMGIMHVRTYAGIE